MSVIEVAKSVTTCLIKAESSTTSSRIWFKSKPVDQTFCYRVAQLQLSTDSCDQGHNDTDSLNPGGWSWFEIVILPDDNSDIPRTKHGKELAWRSHSNRLDPQDTADNISRCYGKVFDRKEEILNVLEVGNVIAIRVCVRYAGWINNACQGRLIAKVLDEDIFSPVSWTLSPSAAPPDIPDTIENGLYSLVSTTESHVQATDSGIASEIWFKTPVLDQFTISKIEDIQLFTVAHHQEYLNGDVDKWSWFDLVIPETRESTKPKVKDGRSLVWFSHKATAGNREGNEEQPGRLFDSQDEILKLVEPGNVIGVRVCAQFSGWETHAHSGRLVVRISNKGPRGSSSKPTVDWKSIRRDNVELQRKLDAHLEAAGGDDRTAVSIESELLSKELRADHEYGAGDRPLKLLSLDGGGVRGISCLYILKDIMSRIAGDPNAKPCDYFDMMAGTSTGGLIAIMLGRLRMTVDQCIEAYQRLASKIFKAGALSQIDSIANCGARYSGRALEDAIKEVVEQYTGDADAPMRDPLENPCKVFVLACRADDISNHIATHLRTYTNLHVEKSFADYKIWEAARATSAAPTYFPCIKLGDYETSMEAWVSIIQSFCKLVPRFDRSVSLRPRPNRLMGEARLYYGFAREFGCLVTIGTGMAPNITLSTNGANILKNAVGTAALIKGMSQLATKSEHADQVAKLLVKPGHYFRFNVGVKIAEKRWIGEDPKEAEHFTLENWANTAIDLDDYKGMGTFVQLTADYLKEEVQRVAECATKLPPKLGS